MIRCEGLTRDFGPTRAVDGMSLEVADGTIVALLGPNGAGKTTSVRMLAGLIGITGGRAWIDDVEVGAAPDQARARSGLLMGEASLYGGMTLEAYLTFFGEAFGLGRARARTRAAELAEMLGLSDRVRDRLDGFSKGMRQRVALARALVNDPRALFLDEPTSALDVEAAIEFRGRIKGFRDERRSVILCTHVLEEAEELADEVVVIQRGRIIAHGTTGELKRAKDGYRYRIELTAHAKRYVKAIAALPLEDLRAIDKAIEFRTADPRATNPAVVRALIDAGASIVTVAEVDRTLQDAYVEIVRSSDGV